MAAAIDGATIATLQQTAKMDGSNHSPGSPIADGRTGISIIFCHSVIVPTERPWAGAYVNPSFRLVIAGQWAVSEVKSRRLELLTR